VKTRTLDFYKLLYLIFVFSIVKAETLYASDNEYWQQEVNYQIDVTLNDTLHELNGFINIEYVNNSPDDITFIYMHLWPNAYKDHTTEFAKQKLESGETDFYFARKGDRGYIDNLDFMVDDQPAKIEPHPDHIDICKVILNEPLHPGERINITTPFHVKIPKNFSRLGHVGQSYQISQWYPKPAVYDRDGWHPMPYLDMGEFYSEYGAFDVKITLPADYVVGATGLLQNEEEMEWLDEKVRRTELFFGKSTDNGSGIISDSGGTENDAFEYKTTTKTLHYIQDKIHDFAWFADKYYYVMKGEIELPHSKRMVTSFIMFRGYRRVNEKWVNNGLQDIHDAIYHYSKMLGDYPYDQVTAVTGALGAGDGMEYPMITITEREAIIHEVGHNWFYGILGSNERRDPWIDEGMNTFYENRVRDASGAEDDFFSYIAGEGLKNFLGLQDHSDRDIFELVYLINARRRLDQPINLHATEFDDFNYGAIVYMKAALAFDYLMAFLGEEEFDRIMQIVYETWKFKHPKPSDIRAIFDQESTKDIDWFFEDVLQTTLTSDYKIRKVSRDTLHIGRSAFREITIVHGGRRAKNHGGLLKGPFPITAFKDGKPVHTIWYGPFWGVMDVLFPYGDYDSYKLDHEHHLLEMSRKNNTIRSKGLFKKMEPLKFNFLAGVEDPTKTQIFYTPVVGANYYDKTMLGIAFYNNMLPSKRFEYVAMPMYAFGSEDFVGMGRVSRYWYPKRTFRSIDLSFSVKSFFYSNMVFLRRYQKYSPQMNFKFKKKQVRSHITFDLSLRNVYVIKDIAIWPGNTELPVKGLQEYWVNVLSFDMNNSRIIDPYSLNLTVHQGESFIKSSIEANYKITLQPKKKSIDLRIFAGKFLYNDFGIGLGGDFTYTTTGTNGSADYTYDELYFGRSEVEGLYAHQLITSDGGFKVTTDLEKPAVGNTDNWIVAFNFKSSLPARIPFKVFGDVGLFSERKYVLSGNRVVKEYNSKAVFDAGIAFEIIPL